MNSALEISATSSLGATLLEELGLEEERDLEDELEDEEELETVELDEVVDEVFEAEDEGVEEDSLAEEAGEEATAEEVVPRWQAPKRAAKGSKTRTEDFFMGLLSHECPLLKEPNLR